jgi:hypothetical protein
VQDHPVTSGCQQPGGHLPEAVGRAANQNACGVCDELDLLASACRQR